MLLLNHDESFSSDAIGFPPHSRRWKKRKRRSTRAVLLRAALASLSILNWYAGRFGAPGIGGPAGLLCETSGRARNRGPRGDDSPVCGQADDARGRTRTSSPNAAFRRRRPCRWRRSAAGQALLRRPGLVKITPSGCCSLDEDRRRYGAFDLHPLPCVEQRRPSRCTRCRRAWSLASGAGGGRGRGSVSVALRGCRLFQTPVTA